MRPAPNGLAGNAPDVQVDIEQSQLFNADLAPVPGFLAKVKQLDPNHVPAVLVNLFDYSWFIGFGVAFVVYLALRGLAPRA